MIIFHISSKVLSQQTYFQGAALSCYSCNFPEDANCQDPSSLKDLYMVECRELSVVEMSSGVKSVCIKLVMDVNDVD